MGARMSRSLAPDIVLVIDDDPDSRALLHAALHSAGLTALLAADGARALALLGDVSPDLILLDAVMPAPDGFETCRRIKAQSSLAHIPVIFMTGLSETEHVLAGLNAGGVDYVTKPIILDELIARINVHLGNARLAQSARAALDAAGRKLIATDSAGRVRWTTRQAALVLAAIDESETELRAAIAALIQELGPDKIERPTIKISIGGRSIEIGYIGQANRIEYFFRISEAVPGMEVAILQRALGLTPRESDVLLWIAHGKSNRDTSEILNISSRTVNKHLEQIFIKLGVENRAAAAAIATRIIAMHA
jgi:DNA-binding response OmpR family regulator/DNA-binding CsgD family transcriptional regulator